MIMRNYKNNIDRQSGSTLIISMIILGVIMLIGVTSMLISETQYKLSANLQFEDKALNNGEEAINDAEKLLVTIGGATHESTFTTATKGYYTSKPPEPLTLKWDDTNSVKLGSDSPPTRYMIQQVRLGIKDAGEGINTGGRSSSCGKGINTFLITARGTGPRGTYKYIQSYVGVLSC